MDFLDLQIQIRIWTEAGRVSGRPCLKFFPFHLFLLSVCGLDLRLVRELSSAVGSELQVGPRYWLLWTVHRGRRVTMADLLLLGAVPLQLAGRAGTVHSSILLHHRRQIVFWFYLKSTLKLEEHLEEKGGKKVLTWISAIAEGNEA